jgi:hypothetical protein
MLIPDLNGRAALRRRGDVTGSPARASRQVAARDLVTVALLARVRRVAAKGVLPRILAATTGVAGGQTTSQEGHGQAARVGQ